MVNDYSQLGVRGEEDLGSGLSAVYQYEFGVNVTEGDNFLDDRPKFVGLKGGFGNLTVGTQNTPYYEVIGINDIFNSSLTFGPSVWLGGSGDVFINPFDSNFLGNFTEQDTLKRLANSVYYSTPDFFGFSASAMLTMFSETLGFSNDVDEWTVALKYTRGPLFVGATYIAVNGSKLYDPVFVDTLSVTLDRNQWGISLSYETGSFSVGLTYERGTVNLWGFSESVLEHFLGETDTPWSAYLTGSYTFGNNIISAAYGQLDTGIPGADPVQNYVLGYQYNLSKRTRVWIEYVGRDAQDAPLNQGIIFVDDPGTIYFGDQNAVSIGTRVDF